MNIKKLCQQLLRYIARSLGLKAETFNDMFGQIVQAWRTNYYPPCSRPDLVLGMTPHSDGSALTVLQQNTSSVGLQILKDNTWVPVHPIANALVINIGDSIEVRRYSYKWIRYAHHYHHHHRHYYIYDAVNIILNSSLHFTSFFIILMNFAHQSMIGLKSATN